MSMQTERLGGPDDVARKLAAVQSATSHSFPAGDIDGILGEIERGYMGSCDSSSRNERATPST